MDGERATENGKDKHTEMNAQMNSEGGSSKDREDGDAGRGRAQRIAEGKEALVSVRGRLVEHKGNVDQCPRGTSLKERGKRHSTLLHLRFYKRLVHMQAGLS